MKKAIEISVLRVSSNGKYIEFIINCPGDYFFTDFVVNVYGGDDKYSLKDCLFEAKSTDADAIEFPEGSDKYYHNKHYYSGQFKIEDLGVDHPEMFEINLEALHNPACEEEEAHYTGPLEATAYISDVSKAYTCLMNDILSMGEDLCGDSEVTDRVIRNYLILYAHLEAMTMKELPEAKKYFTLLQNCFSNCGDTVIKSTCNLCNGGALSETVRYNTYKPSGCNCGR